MKKKTYSHSRLKTFEQCPLKFRFKYIDKIPEVKQSIEAHLGGVVHSTLEWLYTKVKEKQIPTLDELLTYYTKKWEEEYNENVIIIRKELTKEDYFNKGIEFLLRYYKRHKPFDDNTLELEKQIIIGLDQEGNYKLQGFIDRLAYNLQTQEYEIHDYKTGNFLPSQSDIDNDRQLALYSLAIKELFGHEKEVVLIWHFLAHDKKIHSKRSNSQLQQLKKETLGLIKQIEATKKFPPYVSKLCDWCEYKSVCPAWGNKPPQRKLEEFIREEKNK